MRMLILMIQVPWTLKMKSNIFCLTCSIFNKTTGRDFIYNSAFKIFKINTKQKKEMKRPSTVYVRWFKDNRDKIVNEIKSNKVTDVSREASRRWKNLKETNDEIIQVYREQYNIVI